MPDSLRDRLSSAAAQLKQIGEAESAEADRLHADGKAASAHRLRADEAYDAATAVEAILAPRGYLLLKRDERMGAASPLTVTTNEEVKKALLAAGREFSVVFSGLAEEAYRAVRDGQWVPPKPVKAARGTVGGKAVLNVRIDEQLRQDVREMLPALVQETGYPITEGHIVLSYICEELGIERPGAGDAEWLRMVMPAPLVDHFKEQVKAEKTTFQKVLADGLTDLADGVEVLPISMWVTEAAGRPRDGGQWIPINVKNPLSAIERARLDLKLNADLMDRIRHRAGIESSRHQILVHPGMVGRAILTSRLGEPEGFVTTFDPTFE